MYGGYLVCLVAPPLSGLFAPGMAFLFPDPDLIYLP